MPSRKDRAAAARMLRHQVDLLRLEAGARLGVLERLSRLSRELEALVRRGNVSEFSKRRIDQLLSSADATIQRYYEGISRSMGKVLDGAGDSSARHAKGTVEATLAAADVTANLPTEAYLERLESNAIVQGAPSAEWWERQADDTSQRFSNAVRQGAVAGDTVEQMAARVAGRRGYPGVMDIAMSNARSLVHTSVMEVANEARMQTFRQNADVVEGVRQVSTLDSHTTEICMAYDGCEWDLDGEPRDGTELPFEGGPPRHWGCRSVLVPITKSFKELGVNAEEPGPGERASADGQVPGDMTFGDWLDTQTKEEQDDILGPGRAEMWRGGKITLTQLLDLRGNPLTLEQLRDKYDG